jgi:hypothetical protein
MTDPADQWKDYRREAGHRLQPWDPGYVLWSLVKQDLLDVVLGAIANECTRIAGTVGANGLPVPGSNLMPGTPNFTAFVNPIQASFPVVLYEL